MESVGPRRLVDYRAGATYLNVSYWQFRELTLKGAWPYLRVGGRVRGNVRVDLRDLDAWIEAQKQVG